ncbi:MAG: glycoside hydrolase family 3 protein, partial [Nonomuraea sp.]|nr:glycoside hydrolase family 3 protein [Nonomuraea sp.]
MNLPAKGVLTTGRDVWTSADGLRLSDGPHGLRYQEPDANSLDFADSRASTCFPPAVALGCTWDRDLIERVGAAIGAEAAALGVDVVLGPGVNIKRSPLCGRNFEYFAEDPLLSGEAGAALVRGLQGAGVGACVKHYAANNQETDRLRVSADVDERPLREIYLRAFERVVRQAAPWTVMAAYNAVNGIPATQNRWLLTEVLREEWGFDGVVMSDWGAVKDRVAALRAGLDLEMPGSGSAAEVVAAVESGILEEDVLDLAVERLTALSRRARHRGVPSGAAVPYGEHHELAREAAARGIVLLKNDGGLLPLDPASTIAVVGELARTPRYQGGGSSHVRPTRLDTPLDHLGDVLFSPDADLDLVRRADTTVLFLGLPEEEESEGY